MVTPSWLALPDDTLFPLTNLPYGVFSADGTGRRVGVAVGDRVLDVGAVATATESPLAPLLEAPSLDRLLPAGRRIWKAVRGEVTRWLSDGSVRSVVEPRLYSMSDVELHLPFTVADYVDFYCSEHHATNAARIMRPEQPPLSPNWKHMPIGYHGRAGSVVVSGTPVHRPRGQRRGADGGPPTFGPSERLDVEAEVGFVVGTRSTHGRPVPLAAFADHVFGVCLVNDWSARDIQAWESQPLGPFLGKSFATSVSPWVVPLDALRHARVPVASANTELLPYLRESEPWGLDLVLEVRINGEVVSRPPYSLMHWSPAQMLAHLTVNGAAVRTGDLFASGTVSGPEPGQRGCLLELTSNGAEPVRLSDGTMRGYLQDGDEVVIAATAPGPDGSRIGFGDVRGRVQPALVG